MSAARSDNQPHNEDAIEMVEESGREVKADGEAFTDIPLQENQQQQDGPKEKQASETPRGSRPGKLWEQVRHLWKKHGVVEIGPNHRRYEILCCIKEAIKDLIQNHPDLGPKDSISPDDFKHVEESTVTLAGGKTFQFRSYASGVFSTLRRAIGLDEESYMKSLAPDNLPYMEFISNSKGGRDFFLTNDKAYFMKTEKKYYVKVFLDLLDDYLNHFLKYPHSLVVKYLGLHSIKVPGEGQMYFYVMQSIYLPDDRIVKRYDVKGCLAGRFQEPPPEGSQVMAVLKDENFVNSKEVIELGSQKEWFLQQLSLDINFMKRLKVQDYSLLVAYYPLQSDEKKQDFADLALRLKKSVMAGRTTSSSGAEQETTHSEVDTETTKTGETEGAEVFGENNPNQEDGDAAAGGSGVGNSAPPAVRISPATPNASNEEGEDADLLNFVPDRDVIKDVNQKLAMSFLDTDYLDMTQAENRRLLPKSRNPLHIIDGPNLRYHLGIIDFFTLYECRQRVGRVLKNVKFCCGDHSTIPPPAYGDRMFNFISDHTT